MEFNVEKCRTKYVKIKEKYIDTKEQLFYNNIVRILPGGPAPGKAVTPHASGGEGPVFCLRRKEASMYVSWDQLIQLLILIVSLIVLILTIKSKENR